MRHSNGFTLVELLVVAAVVAILALLAYPGYTSYMVKARRTEAQMALLTLMQQQENFYTHYNTYVPFSADATDVEATRFRWWLGEAPASSAYEFSGQACPERSLQQCIELRASPGTARVNTRFRDRDCETLTMDSRGVHGATGPMQRCWP